MSLYTILDQSNPYPSILVNTVTADTFNVDTLNADNLSANQLTIKSTSGVVADTTDLNLFSPSGQSISLSAGSGGNVNLLSSGAGDININSSNKVNIESNLILLNPYSSISQNSSLNVYSTGTFTLSYAGTNITTRNITYTYVRIGNLVTLNTNANLFLASGTWQTASSTGTIPSDLYPLGTQVTIVQNLSSVSTYGITSVSFQPATNQIILSNIIGTPPSGNTTVYGFSLTYYVSS